MIPKCVFESLLSRTWPDYEKLVWCLKSCSTHVPCSYTRASVHWLDGACEHLHSCKAAVCWYWWGDPESTVYHRHSPGSKDVYLISKQALIQSICPHAQGILEGQMDSKGSEPLPKRAYSLFFYDSLATMPNAWDTNPTSVLLKAGTSRYTTQPSMPVPAFFAAHSSFFVLCHACDSKSAYPCTFQHDPAATWF